MGAENYEIIGKMMICGKKKKNLSEHDLLCD
jgi:hypothetical protein